MGLFTSLGGRLVRRHFIERMKVFARMRTAAQQLQPAPLAPHRLEQRRVLDGAAVEALLDGVGPLSDTGSNGEYVQVSESTTPQAGTVSSANEAPSNVQLFLGADSIFENEVLQLALTFEDPDLQDTHRVVIDWGDGTPPETFTLDPGARFLGTSHQYLDDNPTGTPLDLNAIQVTISDSEGNTVAASTEVEVINIAPVIEELSLTPTVDENGIAELSLIFADPGTQDTHTIEIDFGDGSPLETFTLGAGTREFSTTHQFLDDNPTSTTSDINTVRVSVIDDDSGAVVQEREIIVNNVSPIIESLTVTLEVDENGIAELSLEFSDPGSLDTHTIEIDFGDGTPVETFTLDPGTRFFATTHQYLDDNPTGTASDLNTIRVTVIDDDGGEATAEQDIIVNNVAPTIDTLSITSPISEGQFATLTGTFSDPGPQDTFELDIDFDGDGLFEQTVTVSGGAFSVSQQFLDDNPTGTSSDTFNVNVRLRDDDTGSDEESVSLMVNNEVPTLVVADDQTIDEGALLDLTGGALGSFTDLGILDIHTATIDFGDGSPIETVVVNQGSGFGTLDASHTFADNGVFTVTVTLTDDDGGVAVGTFDVTVENVAPILTGIDSPLVVNEGQEFTLSDLGIGLSDPGFDNPLNVGGEIEETFVGFSIDWGDGSLPTTPLNIVNRVSGSEGVLTTADFEHAAFAYADNGTYTVTVEFSDDDGGLMQAQFVIQVNNVAPTLVLTDEVFVINEGEVLDLPNLGTFSDPGFNNPLNVNDPSNGSETEETFTFTIDFGDGTVETGQLPASVIDGSQGVATLGTLVSSHLFLDNDAGNPADTNGLVNVFTITVTLSDDDGGSVTGSIDVTVFNVDPAFADPAVSTPISATDVNINGETFLTLEFSDPGTETLTVFVDFGDQLSLPPDQRFVAEAFIIGPGVQTITIPHVFTGPPDPLNPAADIVISAFIQDDDFGLVPGVQEVGVSEILSVVITNPGIGTQPVAIDTTPQVPRLVFPANDDSGLFFLSGAASQFFLQSADLQTVVTDTNVTTDRFLELRVIDPATGEQEAGFRLKPEVLNNLPGLFRTLPDNRYSIYLVRTETNTRRLVIEVFVRNGEVIDPSDDSEGTRDRPPTDETTEQLPVDAVNEAGVSETQGDQLPEARRKQVPNPRVNQVETSTESTQNSATNPMQPALGSTVNRWAMDRRTPMLLGTTLIGLAASQSARSWSERIDRAVAAADARQWQRLRRRPRFRPSDDQK